MSNPYVIADGVMRFFNCTEWMTPDELRRVRELVAGDLGDSANEPHILALWSAIRDYIEWGISEHGEE